MYLFIYLFKKHSLFAHDNDYWGTGVNATLNFQLHKKWSYLDS